MSHTPDAKVELVRLLRLFEEIYSATRGLPWVGTVRPEQAFARAADEIERLRVALEQSDTVMGEEQSQGVSASPSGFRPADRACYAVSPVPASIPNAPLQPAAGFINAIADRFQEAHVPPLPRDRALLLALTAMADAESDLGPINHPDFDWSLDGARVIADENIEHWERPNEIA